VILEGGDEVGAGRRLKVAVLIPDAGASFAGRGDENFEYAGAEAADRHFLSAVEAAGFDATVATVHLGNVEEVVGALDCDAVINLCDGSGAGRDGLPGLEAIEALEWRGIPYTGARAEAYRIGSSKVAMKERFRAAGVPTAAFQVLASADAEIDAALLARCPLIVKPCDAGGSAGIGIDSVVTDEATLRARVARVCAVYGEALVEAYVDGREVTVGVLGSGRDLALFSPLEVRFGPAFPAGRGLRTFETKWDVASPLYSSFELLCPAPLEPAETRRVLHIARAAYRAIAGSGYGRVDLRLDAGGEPFVLEVNPNCSLEWHPAILTECAMFPIGARAAGLEFPALLRELVARALRVAPRIRAARRARFERLRAKRCAAAFTLA
jgi:D-alanine-D-alanine ligase